MYKLVKYDNWNKEKAIYGSGASEKMWLVNPKNNNKGIFKYPKIRADGAITGEYWAEKLATDIGKLIGIKCAKVDMGTYKRKKRLNEL